MLGVLSLERSDVGKQVKNQTKASHGKSLLNDEAAALLRQFFAPHNAVRTCAAPAARGSADRQALAPPSAPPNAPPPPLHNQPPTPPLRSDFAGFPLVKVLAEVLRDERFLEWNERSEDERSRLIEYMDSRPVPFGAFHGGWPAQLEQRSLESSSVVTVRL